MRQCYVCKHSIMARWCVCAGPFIAMENFHYTAQFLGLPLEPSLQEVALAGQQHCALAWPALQQQHGANVSAEHLLHFCFR